MNKNRQLRVYLEDLAIQYETEEFLKDDPKFSLSLKKVNMNLIDGLKREPFIKTYQLYKNAIIDFIPMLILIISYDCYNNSLLNMVV